MGKTLEDTIEAATERVHKKAIERNALQESIRNIPVEHTEAEPTAEELAEQVVPEERLKKQPFVDDSTKAYEAMQKRRDTADTVFLNEDGTVPTPPAE